MHKILNWRFVAGTAIVVLAFCVGLFLYVRWDLQRFTESLSEPRSVPSQSEAREKQNTEQTSPTPAREATAVSEKQQTQESGSMRVVLDTETTGADPGSKELSEAELDALLEMFEQQALSTLREAVDVEDEELDNTELVEAIEEEYGPSPEVNVLSAMMERIDAGTATLDNLIEMVEASSAIMPESMPEGTMSLLGMLRQAKAGGGLMVFEVSGDDRSGTFGVLTGVPPGTRIVAEKVEFVDHDGNVMELKPKAVIK